MIDDYILCWLVTIGKGGMVDSRVPQRTTNYYLLNLIIIVIIILTLIIELVGYQRECN